MRDGKHRRACDAHDLRAYDAIERTISFSTLKWKLFTTAMNSKHTCK